MKSNNFKKEKETRWLAGSYFGTGWVVWVLGNMNRKLGTRDSPDQSLLDSYHTTEAN